LIAQLCKFFRNQEIAECAAAEKRQKRIAKFMQTGRKSIDGLGRPVLEVDEAILGHWRSRLGYNPLKDSGWVKYMTKHFPELRVTDCIGTKEIMVGYGSKSFGVTKRFAKSYG
jgi:hypothetical protein